MDYKFGVDISKFNKITSIDDVKKECSCIILKASQGHSIYSSGYLFTDPSFSKNAHLLVNNKIPFGAYHFFTAESEDDAKKEANFFCDTIDPYKDFIMYAICDAENYGNKYISNISSFELSRRINAFCKQVEKRGYKAAHYTNPDHIAHYINIKDIPYPVWIADYAGKINPESSGKIIAIQTSDKGRVKGISGNVDTNHFYCLPEIAIYKLYMYHSIDKDFWIDRYKKVKYLDLLLERCADRIAKCGYALRDSDASIYYLAKIGIINTPEYWIEQAHNSGSVARLIMKLAAAEYKKD